MGFDDVVKDILDNIDWGDAIGSLLQWIISNPNVYAMGVDMVISLIRIIGNLRGMSEEEAKAAFKQEVEKLRNTPDAEMNFTI